jgi:hypothetical protein
MQARHSSVAVVGSHGLARHRAYVGMIHRRAGAGLIHGSSRRGCEGGGGERRDRDTARRVHDLATMIGLGWICHSRPPEEAGVTLKPRERRYILTFHHDSGMALWQFLKDFYLVLRKYNMMHNYCAT